MKKIEVIVNIEGAKKVEEVLDKLELLPSTSEIKIQNEKFTLLSVLLPDELAEESMKKLSDAIDQNKKENIISLSEVEGATSSYLDKLKEKAAKKKSSPNPVEELVEETDRYTHFNKDVLAMSLLATLIALAGLFLDNVIIIIGAMILPPLLGPINALAVNANLGNPKKLLHSQISILILLFAIIGIAALTTLIAGQFIQLPTETDEIVKRSGVTVFDILVALVIGIAAGLVFRVALPENLFGVAISVALIPPATVAGIQLALLNEILFVGAFILLLVNLFALEFGCTLSLRLLGVTPRNFYKEDEGKRSALYSIILLAILLLILAVIILFSPTGPSN
jgi:uncharacterized hydrophobic protein (TIGR00341 family)